MNFALVIQLLPFILKLMEIVERVIKDGKVKKEIVMATTEVIIGGIQSVSTGGQAETWDRIAEPISAIIDNAATIMFPEHTGH